MRVDIYAVYITEKGRRIIKDAYGNTISLDEIIKQFNPKPGEHIPVRLVIDDGKHETLRCDPWTLKLLRDQGRKFDYCLPDGRKIKMLATDAAGNYPYVGQNDAKEVMSWNKFGAEKSGEAEYRLMVQAEILPPAETEEKKAAPEPPAAPAAQEAPEPPAAEEEHAGAGQDKDDDGNAKETDKENPGKALDAIAEENGTDTAGSDGEEQAGE